MRFSVCVYTVNDQTSVIVGSGYNCIGLRSNHMSILGVLIPRCNIDIVCIRVVINHRNAIAVILGLRKSITILQFQHRDSAKTGIFKADNSTRQICKGPAVNTHQTNRQAYILWCKR